MLVEVEGYNNSFVQDVRWWDFFVKESQMRLLVCSGLK